MVKPHVTWKLEREDDKVVFIVSRLDSVKVISDQSGGLVSIHMWQARGMQSEWSIVKTQFYSESNAK